eukprot:COSAG05_NODE_19989_length_284_cov_1.118919_1_plen_38_part_01
MSLPNASAVLLQSAAPSVRLWSPVDVLGVADTLPGREL